MNTETIDHNALTRLVEAGAVRETHVAGQPGGWSVVVRYGKTERPLAATRSREVRVFRKLETLVAYLRKVGISHFDVDAEHHEPDAPTAVKRPDRAAALRQAHEAAAHDKWFREQVGEALKEADDPQTQWVPHEVVKSDMASQRAALKARIAKRK